MRNPFPRRPKKLPPEPSSLLDRLTNVITSPGEVFAELKDVPVRTTNWLVPFALICVATIVYMTIAFSQAGILRSMQDQREKAMQKQVASGKITQAQADQAAAMTEKFMTPTILKIFGAGTAICMSAAAIFIMGLAVWLALKMATDAKLPYMKVVEVCGLSLVIDVPQKILRTWLVSWKENFLAGTASPALFIDNPLQTNKFHAFLTMIDVIDIWWLAVLSLGISKVAGISFQKSALIVFGIWFGFRVIGVLLLTPQA